MFQSWRGQDVLTDLARILILTHKNFNPDTAKIFIMTPLGFHPNKKQKKNNIQLVFSIVNYSLP